MHAICLLFFRNIVYGLLIDMQFFNSIGVKNATKRNSPPIRFNYSLISPDVYKIGPGMVFFSFFLDIWMESKQFAVNWRVMDNCPLKAVSFNHSYFTLISTI